jgi:hypothetical protein
MLLPLAVQAALALTAGAGSSLDALRATLAALPATDPVRARLEHRLRVAQGDAAAAASPEGVAEVRLADGPDGLTATFARASLARAAAEVKAAGASPGAPTPTRDALAELRGPDLGALLDASPELLAALDHAELVEERDEALDGAPAHLLVLKITPVLPPRQRKYVKELTATARVWLGADGVPRAAERRVKASGRAMLVVGFSSEEREAVRFARQGDRLVVVRREVRQRSEGGGEKAERHAVTTLTLAP